MIGFDSGLLFSKGFFSPKKENLKSCIFPGRGCYIPVSALLQMKLNLFFTCESVFTLIIRPAKEPRRVEGKTFSIPTLSIVRMFNFKTHLAPTVSDGHSESAFYCLLCRSKTMILTQYVLQGAEKWKISCQIRK